MEAMQTTAVAILPCEDRVSEERNGVLVLTPVWNPARCNRPTRHIYDSAKEIPNSGVIPEKDLLYRCEECGNLRRWGRV